MHKIPNMNGSSVLIGTHGLITQTMLSAIGNVRAADIYGFSGVTQERNKTLIAIGKLVTELAKICNFNPVVADLASLQSGKINQSLHSGLIIPFVVPKLAAKFYHPLVKSKASIFLSVYQYFNFVYCDVNREISQIRLNLLLQPFSTLVWIIIVFTSLLVILALYLEKLNGAKISITKAVFMTISAIFSDTIAHDKRNKVLLLWLINCFILNNIYSGVITSLLIAPLEQDLIKTVDDIVKRQFHFVYTEKGYFKNIIFMVKLMAQGFPPNSSLPILSQNIQMRETLPQFVQTLAFEDKTVLFGPFLLILMYWKLLQEMNDAKTSNIQFRRQCHMGKELSSAYSIPEAWIIIMNEVKVGESGESYIKSIDILRTMHRLDAVGIHPYWMDFFYRIQGTKRAQDLNRFKSKTETKDEVPIPQPVALVKGSVSVIFVVYFMTISVAVVVFIIEFMWKRSKASEVRSFM